MRYGRLRGRLRVVGRVTGAWLVSAVMGISIVGVQAGDALAQTGVSVSREYPVATPVPGAARFDQQASAVASNGDGYLVVWMHDERAYRGLTGHIRASRLSASGVVVDTLGFDISDVGASTPSVSWNNGVYLVVWSQDIEERTYPCCSADLVPDVYGARVAPDGTVLDPGGFPISTGAGSRQSQPQVAPLGDGFIVTFHDTRPTAPGIRAARVSAAGTVVDPDGIDISVGPENRQQPDVASSGSVALIGWADWRTGNADIRAKRVGADGVLIDDGSFPVTTSPTDDRTPAVAANGTGFLITWDDSRGQLPHVYASRVSTGGAVLDAAGFRVSDVGSNRPQPAIASDGAGYLVTWLDWRDGRANELRGRRVNADGTLADAAAFVAAASVGYGTNGLAWGRNGYLVSWDQYVNGADVFANLVPRSGSPAGTVGVLLSAEPSQQLEPAAAWDGTNYLVAWGDTRSGVDLYAGRIAPDGTTLDGPGFLISEAGAAADAKVVWNGTDHLVVWRDYRSQNTQVYAARVTRDGHVRDPGGFVVSLPNFDVAPTQFDVTAGDAEVMVVWRGYDYATGNAGIYASRVSTAGAVVDHTPIAGDGVGPSVGWNGRRYLVSWLHLGDTRDIHAVRVAKGKVDTDPIVVSAGPAWKMPPEIASDGDNFFVAWSDDRSGSQEVFGARVHDTGKVLDPEGVLIFGASDYDYLSGLVWDGQHYVIGSGLSLIRVTCRAVVVDPGGVTLETPSPWLVGVTDMAAGSAGKVAILLNRSRPEAPYNGGTQAVIRFVQEPSSAATLAVEGQRSGNPSGKGGEGATARC